MLIRSRRKLAPIPQTLTEIRCSLNCWSACLSKSRLMLLHFRRSLTGSRLKLF
jgi:hypothetical protein